LNIYETDKLLAEYLLFHYGSAGEILPYEFGPQTALDFPARCVTECIDQSRVRQDASALDLGCAVGRATFELARFCARVTGIDRSQQFIRAAQRLAETGSLSYLRTDEGMLTTPLAARVPAGIDRQRVKFAVGDATDLHFEKSALSFDVVLMANLIDRVDSPRRCLAQLASIVKQSGQLVITSPYTWLEEFTPRAAWLGGFERDGVRMTTLDGLQESLAPAFTLAGVRDLPFLIREHARKFQWSVAQASIWIRKED